MINPTLKNGVRGSTGTERDYAERTVRGHRLASICICSSIAVFGIGTAAFAITESLLAATFFLVLGVGGAWALGRMSAHIFRAHVTDGIATFAGPVIQRGLDGGDPLRSSNSIGSVRAVVPRGWAAMVGEDDCLDVAAIVLDTARPGENDPLGDGRRYIVVTARRDSDGATFSVSEEIAAGGARYHLPLSGGIAPVAWAFGVAVAFTAVVAGPESAAADDSFSLPMVLVAAGCFGFALASGIPFLRSRARVEAYRARTGLMQAAERRRRRAREAAVAAAVGVVAFGLAAPLAGAPMWLGAVAGVFFLVPFTWFRTLPPLKTRS